MDDRLEQMLDAAHEAVDLLGVVVEVAGDANVAAAAEIDDGDFDSEVLPDGVLERVGDGAGFVGGCWREGDMGHAAVPSGIVGDDRF